MSQDVPKPHKFKRAPLSINPLQIPKLHSTHLLALPEVILPLLLPDGFLVVGDDLLGSGLGIQYRLHEALLSYQLAKQTATRVKQ